LHHRITASAVSSDVRTVITIFKEALVTNFKDYHGTSYTIMSA